MTNAHVAGSRVGREVVVEVESTGDRIRARVIMAAYSDRTWTDWAVLQTIDPYTKVRPVRMSKNRPSGIHYTKGFPRCEPFPGSNINTVALSSNDARWTWRPDAISGQSGSAVWSHADHVQYGLLTWSIGRDGAGQMTSEIYRQARDCTLAGAPRVDGMIEVPSDYNLGEDERGDDDPIVEVGIQSLHKSISSLPIWAEDDEVGPVIPPNEPGDVTNTAMQKIAIEYHRKAAEQHEQTMRQLQGLKPPAENGKPDPDNDGAINHDTFGL